LLFSFKETCIPSIIRRKEERMEQRKERKGKERNLKLKFKKTNKPICLGIIY
jgi:hypothetical protein